MLGRFLRTPVTERREATCTPNPHCRRQGRNEKKKKKPRLRGAGSRALPERSPGVAKLLTSFAGRARCPPGYW